MGIETIIFDMDGVILDSESVWNQVRRDFVLEHGGRWTDEDQKAVMGANSRQWSEHIRDNCGVQMAPADIHAGVVSGLRAAYRRHLPLIEGAAEAVRSLGTVYVMGLASSSPLELVEYALDLAGLRDDFAVLVSSDDVPRGKPEPDVYLEACRRLGCTPGCSAAVEDSTNGIRAAVAAGLFVIAVPNAAFPPAPEAVDSAGAVLGSVAELTPELMRSLTREVCDGA